MFRHSPYDTASATIAFAFLASSLQRQRELCGAFWLGKASIGTLILQSKFSSLWKLLLAWSGEAWMGSCPGKYSILDKLEEFG